MSTVKIQCGECGGFFAQLVGHGGECYECQECGRVVHAPTDIAPNLGDGEVLTVSEDEYLAYTTEEG